MIPLSKRISKAFLPTRDQSTGERKGFVLVEVIVAMVILAIAVSSLAGLVYSVSRSGIKTSGDAYKNGVLTVTLHKKEAAKPRQVKIQSV